MKEGNKKICIERIGGEVIRTLLPGNQAGRLCFLLGTLFQDEILRCDAGMHVDFGPGYFSPDDEQILKYDLALWEGTETDRHFNLVLGILSETSVTYDCMDKPAIFLSHGVGEYLLLDMERQNIYYFASEGVPAYRRCSFEDRIGLRTLPDFAFSVMEVMEESTDKAMKELTLFYRFRDKHPKQRYELLAEEYADYQEYFTESFTAENFYEWLKVRRQLPGYQARVELLVGSIKKSSMLSYQHQRIRGGLYFELRKLITNGGLPYELLFAPMALELKKKGILDSVLFPDLYMVKKGTARRQDAYRGAPELVIEITSPASAAQDYVDKVQIYQYHGVREYWIINDWKRQVMVIDYPAALEETAPVPEGTQKAPPGSRSGFGEAPLVNVYHFGEAVQSYVLPDFRPVISQL